MAAYAFKKAAFVTTAMDQRGYPVMRDLQGRLMPEVAVAGRSNVGKSSLMNNLFQVRGLVKTSSTPGKTQALNFFTVDESLAFVDLPGYGYAKVPEAVRRKWGPMVQKFLDNRPTLKLVLFLFDIRRMPNEDDFMMMDWLLHANHAMIMVFTKVDKVGQSEKNSNTAKILEAFNVENLHYLHYSSSKNIGRQKLMAMINDALRDDQLQE